VPSDAVLEVSDYVTGYGESDIVRGVSFRVRPGEIACIIGPNGAGKSTLLRGIFGLLPARAGRIRLDGTDITALPSGERLRRGMSFVPQGRCNFPAMTVRENLEMGAFIRSDAEVGRDIETVMDKFPLLREKARALAGGLSGGEQQILEMGRALLLRPALVLLDEPSLGLAPIAVRTIMEIVATLNRRGTTILLVEQNVRRALGLCGRGYVVENGVVALAGSREQLLRSDHVRQAYLGM
jgi:branched-chain amino acid transport system ATP-binding protein